MKSITNADGIKMLSVICPVFNEEAYIENVLTFFIESKPDNKELLVIDGGSTDKTIDIVKKWSEKYTNIRLLFNPNKYVPYALNIGIKNSTGDPIIRLDAHTVYSNDYFEKILGVFDETGADIVGGHMNKAGKTILQEVIAYCTSSVFGIGDSKIHDLSFSGFTNHVYLGAWKREIFDQIGCFDQEMKRNQDDEFHYRANLNGKKIFLSNKIKSTYFPRSTVWKLFKQYFQYGFYKPLVLRKLKKIVQVRHIIPALFVIYLITLPLYPVIYLFIPLIIYLVLSIYFSTRRKQSLIEIIASPIIYFILHFAYGSGFIIGSLKLIFEGQSQKSFY